MVEDVDKWAMDRAADLAGYGAEGESLELDLKSLMSFASEMQVAFARYIAAHEEPPVDPLLVRAREIVSEVYPGAQEKIAQGGWDDDVTVNMVLAALREGMEKGK